MCLLFSLFHRFEFSAAKFLTSQNFSTTLQGSFEGDFN